MKKSQSRWARMLTILIAVQGLALVAAAEELPVPEGLAAGPHAPVAAPRDHDNPDKGGGGGPDPLELFNRHVELANGEYYLLVGKVVIGPALANPHKKQAYLEVDTTQHPWLLGRMRQSAPLYPLEGASMAWKIWDGATVKIAACAHAQVLVTPGAQPILVMSLELLPELSTIPYGGN